MVLATQKKEQISILNLRFAIWLWSVAIWLWSGAVWLACTNMFVFSLAFCHCRWSLHRWLLLNSRSKYNFGLFRKAQIEQHAVKRSSPTSMCSYLEAKSGCRSDPCLRPFRDRVGKKWEGRTIRGRLFECQRGCCLVGHACLTYIPVILSRT